MFKKKKFKVKEKAKEIEMQPSLSSLRADRIFHIPEATSTVPDITQINTIHEEIPTTTAAMTTTVNVAPRTESQTKLLPTAKNIAKNIKLKAIKATTSDNIDSNSNTNSKSTESKTTDTATEKPKTQNEKPPKTSLTTTPKKSAAKNTTASATPRRPKQKGKVRKPKSTVVTPVTKTPQVVTNSTVVTPVVKREPRVVTKKKTAVNETAWPVKHAAVVPGDIVLGGLFMLLCMILFLKVTVPVVSRHVGQYMKIIMRGPDTYTRTGLKENEVDQDREAIIRRFPLQSMMYRKFYDSSVNQNVTTQRQWRSISPHNTESKPLNRRRPTIGPMEYAPAEDDTPRNANFWRPSNWFTQKLHKRTEVTTKAEESTTSLSPFYKNLLKNSEESHTGNWFNLLFD
ncbi:unnamed protein product [Plutella xylostella]|uniref:(diamondback moth) hypothetical protein n=1 Tax=Plutella xylostella TaxID=51655 RepID=A0A8S4FC68_PLUXY|nr:unnamed protein product [Plutella xylostella]